MSKTKTRKIKTVLVKAPGQEPELREIADDLGSLQAIVGGMVQVVPVTGLTEHGIDLWVNEEGKLDGLPPNFTIFDGADLVVGTAFFSGRRGSGMSSLTEKQQQIVRDYLKS